MAHLLGYQLYWIGKNAYPEQCMHQTRILYDTWETALQAGEELANKEANEYCMILNKVDDLSLSDCHLFKHTALYILVDERDPHEKFGAVYVCPVYKS
jgi:hypothetical protein